MLFETLSQPQIFFTLALFGFLSGFFFDFSGFIVFLCNKSKIVKGFLDFLTSIGVFFLFYLAVSKIDFGAVRPYHLFAFFTSLSIERITLGNIIAKFFDWWYTFFANIKKKLFKSKKGQTKEENETEPNNAI